MIAAQDFTAVPLASLTNPNKQGPLWVYKDYYWALDEENNAFFFKGKYPQCNQNEEIVKRLMLSRTAMQAIFVPWAWVQFDLRDYC